MTDTTRAASRPVLFNCAIHGNEACDEPAPMYADMTEADIARVRLHEARSVLQGLYGAASPMRSLKLPDWLGGGLWDALAAARTYLDKPLNDLRDNDGHEWDDEDQRKAETDAR